MPLDTRTDEELVRASLSDKECFGVLVERYAPRLRSYIGRVGVQSPEDREDIVQETFVRAYMNLHDVDTSLQFSSWLYRIAHNQTMTFFRKRKARPEGHSTELPDSELDTFASASDVFGESARAFDAQKLREVLTTLPRDYYDIVILRYFEHKSYDEISDILSLAPGTVATRLNRAKARLKKIMQSNGYHHG